MSVHKNKKPSKGSREFVQVITDSFCNVIKTIRHYNDRYTKRMMITNEIVERQYEQNIRYHRRGYCLKHQ